MKIDDRVANYMALLDTQTAKPAANNADASEPKTAVQTSPAEVALSPKAVQLAEDDARRQRLEAIRQQLAEGSYNISGKDVAGKILNVLKG